MTTLIIGSSRAPIFAAAARETDPGFDIRLWPDAGDVADIRYALAWGPPPGALATLPNLELIVSVGAGVDHLLKDATLPDVPIVRFVDADLTERMVSYVAANVLFHQRRMIELREMQQARVWQYLPEPAPHDITVGIMGFGVLGEASAKALQALGFRIAGWTRAPRQAPGIATYAGARELDSFLAATDVLVALLPLTPETTGIINLELLRKLRRPKVLPGPVLINAGRGGSQVEADIIAALDAGVLYAASLDVLSVEPLPATHPVWGHKRILLTPHIAAESDPHAIVRYLMEQVRRKQRGEVLPNLIDRQRGY